MRAALRLLPVVTLLTASFPARADGAKDVPAAHPKSSSHLTTGAGGAYRALASLPAFGGELMLGYGADRNKLAAYGEARYAYHQTPHGLPFHSGHLGGTVSWILSPVRLGIGFQFGFDAFGRRTGGGLVARWTMGPIAVFSIDVVDLGRSTMLVGLRGDLDVTNVLQLLATSRTEGKATISVVPGASAFVGVRF